MGKRVLLLRLHKRRSIHYSPSLRAFAPPRLSLTNPSDLGFCFENNYEKKKDSSLLIEKTLVAALIPGKSESQSEKGVLFPTCETNPLSYICLFHFTSKTSAFEAINTGYCFKHLFPFLLVVIANVSFFEKRIRKRAGKTKVAAFKMRIRP